MLGNLSQTVVQVPYFFHLLTKLSSKEFDKTRYREPPLLDTFSQLQYFNKNPNKNYFRVKDHFKDNSPYKDLNYNNNKKYLSSISKLKKRSFEDFFILEKKDFSKTLKRNNSQVQIISNINNNSINSSKEILIKNNSNIENNRYNLPDILNKEGKNKFLKGNEIKNINENIEKMDENNESKNNNDKNNDNNNLIIINNDIKNVEKNNDNEITIEDDNDEKKRMRQYIKKLQSKKPNNIKELKDYLEIKYIEKQKENILPKIKGMHHSISQEDLFKRTIERKIESLTMIKPEIKNSIYRRKKNIILKKDYDILHKIYANNRNFPFLLRKTSHNYIIE